MSTKLIVSDGKRERALVLVDKILVGRDPTCDVSHEDDLLSRRHAEFVAGSDSVTVRDLGSRNGIFVNGLRTAERAIYPGDVVQVGPLRVLYAHDVRPASILPEQVIADRTVIRPPPSVARPAPAPPPPVDTSEERTQVLTPPLAPAQRPPQVARDFSPANTPDTQPQPPHAAADLHDGPTQFIPAPRAVRDVGPRDSRPASTPNAQVANVTPDIRPANQPAGSLSATRITPAPSAPASAPAPEPAATRPWQSPPAAITPPDLSPAPPPPTVELSIDAIRSAAAPVSARSVDSDLKGYVFGQSAMLAVVVLCSAIVPLWLTRADALGVWLIVPLMATIATTYLVATFINRRFARIVRAMKPDRS